MSENQAVDLIIALLAVVVGGSFGIAIVKHDEQSDKAISEQWQELGQKVKSQNKEISSLLQSMRQEREEMKQESEQGQQRLSSAVLRMEERLLKMKSSAKQ